MTDSEQPLHLIEDQNTGNRFLAYETGAGVRLELHYAGETLWMSQDQIAALFGVDRSGIAKHLANIFAEDELQESSVCAKFARTAADGKSYDVQHYNLDAVISVGYRVNSKQGTLFRKWGSISHADAIAAADTEYAKFDHIRRQYRINQYTDEIAELKRASDELPKPRR